jgi:hypothetical protein
MWKHFVNIFVADALIIIVDGIVVDALIIIVDGTN